MTSKFNEKVEAELQFFPEMLMFYSKCFTLYRNCKSDELFRRQLQTICPEEYVDQVLEQIQSFVKIINKKQKKEISFFELQQQIKENLKEKEELLSKPEQQMVSILLESPDEASFYNALTPHYQPQTITTYLYNIQNKLLKDTSVKKKKKKKSITWTLPDYQSYRKVYEKYQPYFNENEQLVMSHILTSKSDAEVDKKLENIMAKNMIAYHKTIIKKKLLNPLDYVKKANQTLDEIKAMKSTYKKYQIYFTQSECEVMDVIITSNSQLEVEEKLQDKLSRQSIHGYEMSLKKKLSNPEQLLNCVNKQLESFRQLKDVYTLHHHRLTENECMVMDALLSSKTNAEVYSKLKNKLPKKMISIYKSRLKQKLSLFKKSGSENSVNSIYYLYQPYIPEEYQKAYEQMSSLNEKEREKYPELYEKYNDVNRFLVRCERAVKQKSSLPKFSVQKKVVKKDVRETKINSLFPGEVKNMLDNSIELSEEERKLLCQFYGIGTTKHSLEQLQEMYLIPNRNILKNRIYHALETLEQGRKNEHPEQNEMRSKLKEKFVVGSLQLSKTEAKLLDFYYGITGPRKSLEELSRIYHLSQASLMKKIHYASNTVLNANAYTNPAMIKAIQNLSTKSGKDNVIQDREIRPLRLLVKQSIYLSVCPLTFSQKKLLDSFYGLSDDKGVMSTEELAEKYQIPLNTLRFYLYETVRYILNYVTETEFHQQMEANCHIDEEVLEKKLKR